MISSKDGVVRNAGSPHFTLVTGCLKGKSVEAMAIFRDYQKMNNQPYRVPYFDVKCQYCGSHNIIKYGHKVPNSSCVRTVDGSLVMITPCPICNIPLTR